MTDPDDKVYTAFDTFTHLRDIDRTHTVCGIFLLDQGKTIAVNGRVTCDDCRIFYGIPKELQEADKRGEFK